MVPKAQTTAATFVVRRDDSIADLSRRSQVTISNRPSFRKSPNTSFARASFLAAARTEYPASRSFATTSCPTPPVAPTTNTSEPRGTMPAAPSPSASDDDAPEARTPPRRAHRVLRLRRFRNCGEGHAANTRGATETGDAMVS